MATRHWLDKQQDRSLEYYVRTERPRPWPSRFESLMSTVEVKLSGAVVTTQGKVPEHDAVHASEPQHARPRGTKRTELITVPSIKFYKDAVAGIRHRAASSVGGRTDG